MRETDGGCIPVNDHLFDTPSDTKPLFTQHYSLRDLAYQVKDLQVSVTALTVQLDVALDRLAKLEAKQGG